MCDLLAPRVLAEAGAQGGATIDEVTGRQSVRWETALAAFTSLYGDGKVYVFRAPGRVNLIGEHTDYNHGYVLPVALDRNVLLLARPRPDNLLNLSNVEAGFSAVSFRVTPQIPPGPVGDWGNYARGAAQMVAQKLGPELVGFDGLVAAARPYGLPRGAGLSSSSALTVVVAIALAHFNKWRPDPVSLAHDCATAEWYVGTRGGIMDHFTILLSQRDCALFLDCRRSEAGAYTMEQVPLPDTHCLIVADSGVRHDNTRGAYNQRVAACRAGVALLHRHYPHITHLRDVEEIPWPALESLLPEEVTVADVRAQGIDLGDLPNLLPDATLKIRARCRHVWSENRRVLAAVNALHTGDMAEVGRLLQAAHASARDDYEISCPEVETMVALLQALPGVAGARLTGAGWGGCVVALVEQTAAANLCRQVRERYRAATGVHVEVLATRPAAGAGLVLL